MTDKNDIASVQPAPKRAILVAEDNSDYRNLIMRRLRELHAYTLVSCVDGQAALEKMAELGTANIAAIITDGKMPNLDGHGLIEAVRKASLNVPILMITGEEESYKQAALEKGANHVIDKMQMAEYDVVAELEWMIAHPKTHAVRLGDEKNRPPAVSEHTASHEKPNWLMQRLARISGRLTSGRED